MRDDLKVNVFVNYHKYNQKGQLIVDNHSPAKSNNREEVDSSDEDEEEDIEDEKEEDEEEVQITN